MRRPFTRSRARFRRIERVFEFLAYAVILAYAVFAFAHWLSERAVLRIETIIVHGAGAVDQDDIVRIATEPLSGMLVDRWIRKGNAVLYPSKRIAERIRALSGWVKDVRVRSGRHAVTIDIEEYVPAFHWCPDDDRAHGAIPADVCWYADSDGRVFTPSPSYAGYPLVRIVVDTQGVSTNLGTYIMEPQKFSQLTSFLRALQHEGFRIRSVVHIEDNDYRIHSDRPWDILWENSADTSVALRALTLAVKDLANRKDDAKSVSEIDLRFDGKVFFR